MSLDWRLVRLIRDFQLGTIISRIIGTKVFVLAAFLIPLAVRAIPEVIAGPYPIGYDTITAYVPYMYDWASGNTARWFNPWVGGWLTFAVFGVLHSSTGLNPLIIEKTSAPVLYGLLGVSEYVFARRVIVWTEKKSLLLVLIASLYFVSLRLSWDLLRNTFGMVFMLLALSVGGRVKSLREALLYSGLAVLATLTHLLVAAILLSTGLAQAILQERVNWTRVLCLIPATVLFCISLFGFQANGFTVIGTNSVPPSSFWTLVYPAYIFLPLLPLACVGARKLVFPTATYWLITCIAGIFLELTPFGISPKLVWPDRWAISMTIPLIIFATEGMFRLRDVDVRLRFRVGKLAYLWPGLILALAVSYVALPVNSALPYYRFFEPSTMLQSTVPIEDSVDVASSYEWLSSNIQPGSIIVAHDSMYGWAREYFSGDAPILRVDSGVSLEVGLIMGLGTQYSRFYTVWWANGLGWYGEPFVPSGFVLQYQRGNFGVFLYLRQA